ncbi:MAG TPA: hypothetical protein VL966_06790 [Alphaproteobacteria bacterium]|jgi:hypothetical protein|nr:hypothetical protein [Alphaproteobacteria bacterium]
MKKSMNTRLPARTRTMVYSTAGQEPSIAEVLAEPIVRTLMKRDAVSEEALVAVIDRARAELATACTHKSC